MKIIHTADWHIGKLLHKIHMTQDQQQVFTELIEIIHQRSPEVLIIAGDIYDRSIPPTEAVGLLDSILTKILQETQTQIIIISGNHDNGERLNFGSSILKNQGLHIATKIEDIYNPVIIDDDQGPVYFYTIPFLEPAMVRLHFQDDSIKSHDDAMRKIIEAMEIPSEQRSVCIAHGYVSSNNSDSEKPLIIGGAEMISPDHFESFIYTALGHLHEEHRAGSSTIRYSGSPMKCSFSEVDHHKGILEVTLKDKQCLVEKIELHPERDLRIIKGKMADLLKKENYSMGNRHDYIKAVLTDPGEVISPFPRLKAIYPNLLALEYERQSLSEMEEEQNIKELLKKDPTALFEAFYNFVKEEPLSSGEKNIITQIYQEKNAEARQA